MRRTMRLAATCVLLCASIRPLSGAVPEAGPDEVSSDSALVGPLLTEHGAWRSKTQRIFDPVEKTLVRRQYTVWDPEPSRDLDFVWVPDTFAEDREGVINGQGRLIWRLKDRPAYDPDFVFAEFHGTVREGRAHGRGRYSERSGLTYDGEWLSGVMEGFGRIKLPNADEYVGQFRAGKANGIGHYVDVTGEIFEGSFLNGRRHGRGTTQLPAGTSYQSIWAGGEETEGSRTVRVSQAGATRAPSGSDELRVAVELPQPSPYVASSAGPVLSIGPGENTVKIWKGDGDIASGEANMLRFGIDAKSGLRLRVGIQNRSTRSVQVTGVLFDVQSSASDLQPALQAKVGRQNVCGSSLYGPTVQFWNFGWSAAENATLRLAFTSSTSTEVPTRFDYAKKLGRIDKTAKTDLEPEIAAAGVNTALLRSRADRTLSCRAKDDKQCLAELKASGIFGSLTALVTEEPAIRAVESWSMNGPRPTAISAGAAPS